VLKVAVYIEQCIADIGAELFKAVFQSSDTACDLWAISRPALNDLRAEIIAGVEEVVSIP